LPPPAKPGFGKMMLGQPDPRPEGTAARAVLQTKLAAVLGAERFQQMIDQTGWNLATEEQPPPMIGSVGGLLAAPVRRTARSG